jgi:hypothetical protein
MSFLPFLVRMFDNVSAYICFHLSFFFFFFFFSSFFTSSNYLKYCSLFPADFCLNHILHNFGGRLKTYITCRFVFVQLADIRKEVQCPICLGMFCL